MIDYKSELNEEQYDAVTTTEGPLLIIAGAGTGKTRTIVYRAAYLIEHCATSSQILMLTFTNQSADEMKARVIKLLGDNVAKDITACTFHSFCTIMLRRFCNDAGLDPEFTIISPSDDADIIDMKKTEGTLHKYDKKGFPPSSKIVEIISQSINRNKTIEEVLEGNKYYKFAEFLKDIEELKEKADEYKDKNSMVNYDDLLLRMNKLLETNPFVQKEISGYFKYVMVDEYQDTNTLQDKILLNIRRENNNIAVVGDDLQSLYAFRGADVQNIISFPQRYAGCRVVKLVKNYRSNQEILDFSNYVVKSATEGFQKKLIGTHEKGDLPIIYELYAQADESPVVMDIIDKVHESGVPYDEMCILARTSFATTLIEKDLQIGGINYVKYGGPKFLDLEYVKDILSYLRVTVRNDDELAWFRILKVHSGIGDFTARKLALNCKEFGSEYLTDKQHARRVYGQELIKLHQELEEIQDLSLKETLKHVIDFYVKTKHENIDNMKVKQESNRTEYHAIVDRHEQELQLLIDMADSYKTITKFLDDLVLDNTSATQNNPEDGSIVISTIHSVKGLEFHTVIIIDCIDGIFPSTTEDNIGTKEDNEELRCFYVAITRAKENLFLISPQNAMVFGKHINGQIPHYLNGGNYLYRKIKL